MEHNLQIATSEIAGQVVCGLLWWKNVKEINIDVDIADVKTLREIL